MTLLLPKLHALPENQEITFFLQVLHDISDGVFHVDNQLRIDYWNAAAERLSGYTAAEAIGNTLPALVLTDIGQKQLMDAVQETLQTGSLWYEDVPTQTEVRHKDGSHIPTEVKVRVQLGAKGTFLGLTGIVRDLRKQRADEAEHEAILVKGLGNAIHDLKNPAGALNNWAEALVMEIASGATGSALSLFAEKILQASEELLLRIRRELDLVQIMSGEVRFSIHKFDLNQEIQTVKSMFEQQIEKNELTIQLNIAAGVPKDLYGDAMYIREIFQNFMGNAIKFTPIGGEVSVDICSKALSEEKVELSCFISDTGVGMTESQVATIFTVSGQKKSTSKDGDGLGLMKAKKLIGAMGGEISVVSSEGQGTTVAFTMRLGLLQ